MNAYCYTGRRARIARRPFYGPRNMDAATATQLLNTSTQVMQALGSQPGGPGAVQAPEGSPAVVQGATQALQSGMTARTWVKGLVEQVTRLFGGGNRGLPSADPTDDLLPETRAWWNSGMGGQWFTEWLLANQPQAFKWTVPELLPLYYVALMATGKTPFWGAPPYDSRVYRQGLTEDAYASIGVDYAATLARYISLPPSERTSANVYVMLPSGGTVERPTVGQPTKGATVQSDQSGKGGGLSFTTLALIGIAAYFLLKK